LFREIGEGVVIEIPERRNWFVFGFLTFWLCGWAIGEVAVPITIFVSAKKDPTGMAFLAFWWSFWTIGGGAAFYSWLWMWRGREILTVTDSALSIKRDLMGRGRTKVYDVSQARRFRYSPPAYRLDRGAWTPWAFGQGGIAFDYGFQTMRFGTGLEEPEVADILERIKQRFPEVEVAKTPALV
jgi:hypothetical protein